MLMLVDGRVSKSKKESIWKLKTPSRHSFENDKPVTLDFIPPVQVQDFLNIIVECLCSLIVIGETHLLA
jgi:hypothetical protein